MQERKFLRENSNCFRGCKSSVHPARECQSNIKCTECNSDKHESALHPGQAPWVNINLHGGKLEPIQTLDITIQFTQICGVRLLLLRIAPRSARPWSMVYPEAEWDKATKPCVIIDQQSIRSLAFFDKFNVQSPTASYTLKICSVMTENMGRIVSGFCIESMNGKTVQQAKAVHGSSTFPMHHTWVAHGKG